MALSLSGCFTDEFCVAAATPSMAPAAAKAPLTLHQHLLLFLLLVTAQQVITQNATEPTRPDQVEICAGVGEVGASYGRPTSARAWAPLIGVHCSGESHEDDGAQL